MSTMEFKGVTWVGNIYQKFEAMCLEVEETMYQDTVKFVENQVQNVGSNMKKFYSDVMQDLVPPSSIDPVKIAAADLPLNPYADTGIHKNHEAGIKEDTKKVDKLFTKNVKVIDLLDGDQVSFRDGRHNVNHITNLYSRGSIKGPYLMENKHGEKGEHTNMCGKKLSKEDYCHTSKKASSKNQLLRNRNRRSSVSEIIQDYAANEGMVMTSPQALVEGLDLDSREEEKEGKSRDDINGADLLIVDCSVDGPVSNVIVSPKSKREKERKPRSIGEGLKAESIEACSPISSHINGDEDNNQSAGEEAFLSNSGRSGHSDTDVIENNDSIEPRKETTKQDDKTELEEACVLVDGNNLSFVSLKDSRHWSYKKKMREAFSLKKKSARKQEYEKLVKLYGDADMRSSPTSADNAMHTLSTDSNTAKLQSHEFCESEWELL